MDKKQIVGKFLEKGLLLDPQALERAADMPTDVLEKSMSGLAGSGLEVILQENLEAPPGEPKVPVPEIELVGETLPVGSDSRVDYLRHFQNRFDRLASIIRERESFRESNSILNVKSGQGDVAATVGMIFDKATTRGGHIVLVAEDGTGRMRVIVPKNSDAMANARSLVMDEVVGILGKYDAEKKGFVAQEIAFPDIEEQDSPLAPLTIRAAFLSDLHYGSSEFMEEAFSRFLDWLGGRYGEPEERELGRETRYVVLCGDLIDEGGNQLLEKYTGLADLLARVPEEVLIFAIPGESDTAGIIEPQVGFLDEALKAFSSVPNFRQGSNPCLVKLSSVPVLLYHGRSLGDWSSSLQQHGTCQLMKEMLVRRHLAPIYGSTVPLSPRGKDPFIISHVPRIFHVGHRHGICSSTYKGVLLLGSPSWRESDLETGAGTVHVVDLSTLDRLEINFAR